jgi:hypothetical protein
MLKAALDIKHHCNAASAYFRLKQNHAQFLIAGVFNLCNAICGKARGPTGTS